MGKRRANPLVVAVWTGVEVRALRTAKRMTLHEFAEHLGVRTGGPRKWEAGGAGEQPRAFVQQLLDTCLKRASDEERARFAQRDATTATALPEPRVPMQRDTPHEVILQQCMEDPMFREAIRGRDIGGIFRGLNTAGLSQRRLAALTGQSQSEVSEIIKGRRVVAYDVLVRIAEGLGVPRGLMGLGYKDSGVESILS